MTPSRIGPLLRRPSVNSAVDPFLKSEISFFISILMSRPLNCIYFPARPQWSSFKYFINPLNFICGNKKNIVFIQVAIRILKNKKSPDCSENSCRVIPAKTITFTKEVQWLWRKKHRKSTSFPYRQTYSPPCGIILSEVSGVIPEPEVFGSFLPLIFHGN